MVVVVVVMSHPLERRQQTQREVEADPERYQAPHADQSALSPAGRLPLGQADVERAQADDRGTRDQGH